MSAQLIPRDEFKVPTHRFRYSAFRLETLQDYAGSGEDAAIAAFLAGQPRPPLDPEHEQWASVLRDHLRDGRVVQRVHVVAEPPSDYARWELTWGYAPSVEAGEDIRIVPVPEGRPWPPDVPRRDFWLFDARELYDMHYATGGMWLGVELVTDPARIAAACYWREAALHHAMPWRRYIQARSDLAAHLTEQAPRVS